MVNDLSRYRKYIKTTVTRACCCQSVKVSVRRGCFLPVRVVRFPLFSGRVGAVDELGGDGPAIT